MRSLRERLRRERGKQLLADLRRELERIRKRCSTLPVIDTRDPEEILDYDGRGLPG